MATPAVLAHRPTHPFQTILRAGLLVGLLDGLDAAVIISLLNRTSPLRIFQFIASGLIGVSAFHGGWAAATLGVLLHFVIATGAAAVFYAMSTKLTMLVRKPIQWGPVYGIGVFLFVHYVVVPLSRTPRQPPIAPSALLNLLFSHIFFVGLPIAIVTARASRRS